MIIAALDLSKTNTGWAAFDTESGGKAIFGSWRLGSAFTTSGEVFARLHEHMMDLKKIMPFDVLYIEKPLEPALMAKINNFEAPYLLYGLAAHAESFSAAAGCRRFHMVHQATWRKSFLGGMRVGKKKAELKALSLSRAKEFGFAVNNDDESDAIGVLDYALQSEGLIPPWRKSETMLSDMGVR